MTWWDVQFINLYMHIECVGGSMDLKDTDLSTNYQTYCDPRLNCHQSLDVAFLIAKYYQNERISSDFPSL